MMPDVEKFMEEQNFNYDSSSVFLVIGIYRLIEQQEEYRKKYDEFKT